MSSDPEKSNFDNYATLPVLSTYHNQKKQFELQLTALHSLTKLQLLA